MLTQHDKDMEKLQFLRDRLAVTGGLTTQNWNLYNSLENRLDPQAYDKRRRDSRLNWYKSHARKLTIKELKEIIAEKKAKGEI